MFGFTISNVGFADTVFLGWDPSPEPDVIGYRIRYGISSENRNSVIDVGTNLVHEIPGLERVCTYFFTVSAYTSDGRESTPSNLLSYRSNPGNLPPVATSGSLSVLEDTATPINLAGTDPEGAPLNYTVVTPPLHGKLSGTAPRLTYTPELNFNGKDSLSFTVNDNTAWSQPALISINVTPVNDLPIVLERGVSVTEGSWNKVSLVAADLDGDPLEYVVTSYPTRGVISGTIPALNYTSTPGFSGTEYLKYTVTDGKSAPIPGIVTIRVVHVNNPPTPTAQTVTLNEDTPKAITLTAVDLDGDPITFSVGVGPTKGVLTGTAPNLLYTPSTNYNGTDAFTFLVKDSVGATAEGAVTLKVSAVNDAPVALGGKATVLAGQSVAITLSASDIDRDSLAYSIPRPPVNGTLSGTGASRTYTSKSTTAGTDSFDFSVSDGKGGTATATVSITIQGSSVPNRAPLSNPLSLVVREDSSTALTLTGSDPEGSKLTFVITRPPSNGTLSGTLPNLQYTPTANFNGSDSMEFTVSDGSLTSAPATIVILVTPENDVPVAQAATITVLEDRTVDFKLSGLDADNDALTYQVVGQPTHGTLSGTPPDLHYTPAPDFNGSDAVTFKVSDATTTSAEATIQITVNPEEDLPLARNATINLREDSFFPLRLAGQDADGDPLSFEIVTPPAHGTLSGAAPDLVYTPTADFAGQDSVSFVVSDGKGRSNPATVTINVTAENDAPIARSTSLTTGMGSPVGIPCAAEDIDGDALTYKITQAPRFGTLSGTIPNLSYTPNPGFAGTEAITFVANDGRVDSAPATVTITISSANRPPVVRAEPVTLEEDGFVTFSITASDPENDPLRYVLVQSVTHGKLSGTLPNLSYRPATNYFGPDSVTFTVSDGTNAPVSATLAIQVTPVNDLPTAPSKSLKTREDTAQNFFLSASDPDGDPLTYTVTGNPIHGTLSGTPPALLYRPNPNFNGTDVVTFTASDSQGTSREATFTFTVTPVNDAPTATGTQVTLVKNRPTTIRLTGTDPDNDALTFAIETGPQHGTLTGTPPNLLYTPESQYQGSDTFTFVAKDPLLVASRAATVSLTILPTPEPPKTQPDRLIVAQGKSTKVLVDGLTTVTANDTLPTTGSISVRLERAPTHGTVTLAADGTFEYQHDGAEEATDSFRYIVSAEGADSIATEVTVQVLRLVELVRTAEAVEVSFTVANGLEYQIEVADDLPTEAASWSTLGRYQPEADGLATVLDKDGALLAQRYYRVRALVADQTQVSGVLALRTNELAAE